MHMAEASAERIREWVDGEIVGEKGRLIHEVAPLEGAGPHALSFIASGRYLAYLQATRAGIVLVRREWLDSVPAESTAIVVDDPHAALYRVLKELHPEPKRAAALHPTAVIADSAEIGEEVSVGPYAVIGDRVSIGAGTMIGAHAVVAEGCRIGCEVTIHGHAMLYPGVEVGDRSIIHSGARLGKEGFGYIWHDGGHRKVPQVGGCIIEEDVEIGTNVTIDRGSIGNTVVGAGTKIDNLVHLGHNVRLGRHTLLISQVGISGSTTVGDGAILGGQVGVGGHLTIGAGARIGGQAGVTADVPAGETYSGYPARPHREALRAQAGVFKLPRIFERLKRLEEVVFGTGSDKK